VISPDICPICGGALGVNRYYDRYILSSYGVLQIPVSYRECLSCESFYYPDEMAGVTATTTPMR